MKKYFLLLISVFFCSQISVFAKPEEYINNNTSRELSLTEFNESFFRILNEERSFMGSLPLTKDDIALTIASQQAEYIISSGIVSYFNKENLPPDERYTVNGGSGALIEILKAFEFDNNQKVILNELLIRQLLEALYLNIDEEKILKNPYITHIGYGFRVSKDKKKFIAVLDFLTKDGDISPLSPCISPTQKLTISGTLQKPYKFKAVTIGFLSKDELNEINDNPDFNFDSENIKPYFPPQDYIAYSDSTRNNWMKVASGLGLLASIGGSPFTGGASTVLAPLFLNSLQNGQGRDIPVKGGINANSNGHFSGVINLGNDGKQGLYFINIIANIKGSNIPLIVSRRTLRCGI